MASVSTLLNDLSYFGGPDYNSKILWIPDSNFELLPVQSPLLRQSLLISSPPLSNMLKSSGSSYLVSGAKKAFFFHTAHKKCDCCKEHELHERVSLTFRLLVVCAHWNKYAAFTAPVAFKDPMIRGSAIHIAYRILAAFFIDMGAKTSIVENLKFYQP
jgi:hypothetical protein